MDVVVLEMAESRLNGGLNGGNKWPISVVLNRVQSIRCKEDCRIGYFSLVFILLMLI